MKFKFLPIALLVLFLQGCGAMGEKFISVPEINTEESLIYVYRNSSFLKGGTYPSIFIDGHIIGPLKNGGYIEKRVPPGQHIIEISGGMLSYDWDQPPIHVIVQAKAGEPVFVKMWLGNAKLLPASYVTLASSNAAVMTPSTALQEIKECKYSR